MRAVRLTLLALVASCILAVPAAAQLGGLKDRVGKQINDAQKERDQQMNDALGNPSNPPPPQPPKQQPQKPTAATPNAPQPIKQGWLTRKAKDSKTDVRMFFAYPAKLAKTSPTAGLVVLQEWWGVNDDIQERVREFAQHGYYAVAPDLYHGKSTADPKEAQKLHDAMTDDAAMVDMKTAADLLEEESNNGVVDAKRIASIGWCMGGQQSLLLSLADTRIKGTVIFYGGLIAEPFELQKLQGPVLGVFGNDDKAPSPSEVERFKEALKVAGKTDVTILQYDGVGHAFASKAAAKLGLYNEAKAKEAWGKTWDWLVAKVPVK